jgi:hypothetical protein
MKSYPLKQTPKPKRPAGPLTENHKFDQHFPANLFEDLTLHFVDIFKGIGRKIAEKNKKKIIDSLKTIDEIKV